MKDWKYILAMAGIVLLELVFGYLMFRFALFSKLGFALLSAAVLGGFIFWQVNSRYREQVKLHNPEQVRKSYVKTGITVGAVIASALVLAIVTRSVFAIIATFR